MSKIVLKVENISKQYRLGQLGTGTISHDLNRMFARIRGKEDPYLQIGDTNDRSTKGSSDYVWSLKNINFEVRQGDVLGIIGKNGAGKSTLLKILSQVTKSTTGKVKIRGRIAALLEVGTGFHPELTGRENVYLNGAILGMTKPEIKSKFDEIVAFSGVEKYIDTPVKRYSSGMMVRLGFAVAAHLEPEILIIDEVLAVGDAEFQKKCLGKMKDVSGEGRTVLFVSHNMAAVKELCTSAILLDKGQLVYSGKTHDVLREYLSTPTKITSQNLLNNAKVRRGNGEVRFTEIIINNGDLVIDPQKEIVVKIKAQVIKAFNKVYFTMIVKHPIDSNEFITNTSFIDIGNSNNNIGDIIEFSYVIPGNTFRTGLFPLYFWLGNKGELAAENYPYDLLDEAFFLNIQSGKTKEELGYNSEEPGGYFNFKINIEQINHTKQ